MDLRKIANSWRVKGIHIYPRISFEKSLDRTCEKLKINKEGKKIYNIVKYDPIVLLDLEDDEDVKDLVLHSNEFACVYIVHSAREECVQEEMVCDALKPGVPLTTRQLAEFLWMSGNPTPIMKIG